MPRYQCVVSTSHSIKQLTLLVRSSKCNSLADHSTLQLFANHSALQLYTSSCIVKEKHLKTHGAVYLDFLQNILPDLLDDVPLNVRLNMIYQHDGCPAHRGRPAVAHINERFGNRWIGYKAPNQRAADNIQWPPRSPELTPVDFFLWGHLKTCVYSTPLPRDEVEAERVVHQRLNEACASLTPEMIQRATQDLTRRATACLTMAGRNFEHNVTHPGR